MVELKSPKKNRKALLIFSISFHSLKNSKNINLASQASYQKDSYLFRFLPVKFPTSWGSYQPAFLPVELAYFQSSMITVFFLTSFVPFNEWVSTARNLIARQSIGQHFLQEINCSTQNLSTAWIQLILAQPDSSSWHFFLVRKVNFLPIEMVNNFICRTCSWPKLPYLPNSYPKLT